MKRIYLLILILLFSLAMANAQEVKLKSYVFGSAYSTQNSYNRVLSTFGQPITGEITNQSNKVESGFWHIYNHLQKPTEVIDNFKISDFNFSRNKTFSFFINPNPIDKELSLTINSSKQSEFILQIIDLIGSVIFEDKFYVSNFNYQRKLDLQYLPIGTYFIYLKTNLDFAFFKIQKK
ncbi:MAG: T9SS type A sorting domain-containing protein [Candidatus Kapabacteria bacterium]|nr:T9SS type A sorting domain-containing protein [Candidatus Kapabacteria bacterium]